MSFIKPDSYITQLQQGKSLKPKVDTTVVADDNDPSAVGGLLALGASIVGATAIGRRIPAVRNYFKPQVKKTLQFSPNKTTVLGDSTTATGQASELITSPSKALVPAVVNKSKYSQVRDIPFTQGQGYKKQNPIVGSAAYDWTMEAPFEKAPAKDWIKWFQRGNSEHPVPTGPLAGVSRRVIPEELDEINLLKLDGNKPVGGYLKFAEDRNMPVDRETILKMITRAPINNVNVLRLRTRGAPENFFTEIADELRATTGRTGGLIENATRTLTRLASTTYNSSRPLGRDSIQDVQKQFLEIGKNSPEAQQGPLRELFKKFNQKVGEYDKLGKKLEMADEANRFQKDANYFPKYKSQGTYAMRGGENYTEDVVYFKGRVPNTKSGQFEYGGAGPHYIRNEIGFIRYDDLPNPKLGTNARHVRVSELQTDLHSPQFDKGSVKTDYFKNKVNTFNTNIQEDVLRKERAELFEKLEPFTEIGRGALTREQQQQVAKLTYQINQLDKQAVTSLSKGELPYGTTAGPLSRSFPDFAMKNILRDMAERNINALSIVPSSMNKAIKMPNVRQMGDELNYGLMNGKAIRRTADGKVKESSDLATNPKVLKRIAKQYGAKFEMFDMPKSNPLKEFKVIRKYSTKNNSDYAQMVKEGRATYTRKVGDEYIFDDHVGAARTEREAEDLLEVILDAGSDGAARSNYTITRMIPSNPDNYVKVPTLIADNEVLKKFLLPMKAYMKTGGLVDKINIFKSLI
jgi:hypothetical protein